jgi:hypothetical protein
MTQRLRADVHAENLFFQARHRKITAPYSPRHYTALPAHVSQFQTIERLFSFYRQKILNSCLFFLAIHELKNNYRGSRSTAEKRF